MKEIFINRRTELENNKMDKIESLSNLKMITSFGFGSDHYKWAISQLRKVYNKLEERNASYLQHLTEKWEKTFLDIYGHKLDFDVFLNHVYLIIILKTTLFLKFYRQKKARSDELININIEDSEIAATLIDWIKDKDIIKDSLLIFQKTKEKISNYDITNLNEDVFRGLYEEIIERAHRHKLGEYYTPRWLVGLILEEVFSEWDKNVPPKILDPACGSGTFLVRSAVYLKNRYNLTSREITKLIAGFDINPIAVIVTKVNLALILNEPKMYQFQIYTRDALKDHDLFNFNMADKYDIIVGNPPWIVLRSIKDKNYQNFVKKEMIKYYLLNNGDVHLHTQLDISTLFFNKCVDKYLHKNGIIGFIMPRSVIGSTHQHKNFRKFEHPPVKLLKIIDLEDVFPLFNMPACVLIGRKDAKNVYPVPLEKYSGELPSRDLSLQEVKMFLSLTKKEYTPKINEEKRSYYYNKFKVGLSIFPRSLYFVDLEDIKENSVSVKTSKEIYKIVKEPWKHELTGEIEKDFIYSTLLPWKMVPFGYIEMHPVVLPILPKNDKYILLDFEDMIYLGYLGLYKWFKNAQKIWDNYKTDKAKERFPRLLDRLNYNNLIEFQHPSNRYVVLYNATGKDITSCVVDKDSLPTFRINGVILNPKGFIADVKTWIFETNSQNEAYYLSTILNSTLLSRLIKPFQPRGLYGARAIHRRPLEFPIPKFDENNNMHIKIAYFGRELHLKVKGLIQRKMSKSKIRKYMINEVRKVVDEVVEDLLQIKEVK